MCLSENPARVWIDVGAHLGEKTFAAAQQDPALRVYAFEPQLGIAAQRMGALANFIVIPVAVGEADGSAEFHVNDFDAASSLLPFNPEGLSRWRGGAELARTHPVAVPVMRLDTFMNGAGIGKVDYLKVDAQGTDLAVIRSAGERLRDIERITVEVQTTPLPLYAGSAAKKEVIAFLNEAGFHLVSTESQSQGQEENLTFLRRDSREIEEALDRAAKAAILRPLQPFAGWHFAASWNATDAGAQARRDLWTFFNRSQLEIPFEFRWHYGLRLNLYLGNDLSRQLFVGGCADPNEFALLDKLLQPGMTFVDAGANDGLYTLFAARALGPEGLVLSFEPSAREFSRLERNVALNGFTNVSLFCAALADRDGEAGLRIAGHEHEGQNTLGDFVHQGISAVRTERVSTRSLDSMALELGLSRLDVIKLDVEGAEARVVEGALDSLRRFRPVILFEALNAALRQQGSSFEGLTGLLQAHDYILYTFGKTGLPVLAAAGARSDNMIAVPAERPLPAEWCGDPDEAATPSPEAKEGILQTFRPAVACWNQRHVIATLRDRILMLSRAVDRPTDLLPFQFAQLMSAAMDYHPDVIIELGRGRGNSTCAFTEASFQKQGSIRVISLCLSNDWEQQTVPRLRKVAPEKWFAPLSALRTDILEYDYRQALAGARRAILFWDAHGFEIAECVLGKILPVLAGMEHLVFMHDLSDTRYASKEHLDYGPHGLWKGNNWEGPRLKIGIVDSAVEQAVAALDFTTRNRLTLDSADHSLHEDLSAAQQSEMASLLGDLFDTQGHWFYFTLNERPGPYTFPQFRKPSKKSK
jgi:FkbM family methyltransferase